MPPVFGGIRERRAVRATELASVEEKQRPRETADDSNVGLSRRSGFITKADLFRRSSFIAKADHRSLNTRRFAAASTSVRRRDASPFSARSPFGVSR